MCSKKLFTESTTVWEQFRSLQNSSRTKLLQARDHWSIPKWWITNFLNNEKTINLSCKNLTGPNYNTFDGECVGGPSVRLQKSSHLEQVGSWKLSWEERRHHSLGGAPCFSDQNTTAPPRCSLPPWSWHALSSVVPCKCPFVSRMLVPWGMKLGQRPRRVEETENRTENRTSAMLCCVVGKCLLCVRTAILSDIYSECAT